MLSHRRSSDLAWLWRRLATAATIRPLAQEPPYAAGTALKGQEKKKKPMYVEHFLLNFIVTLGQLKNHAPICHV